MSINTTFNKLVHDKKVKFTVILGSGYHHQALGGDSILSNWELLLSSLTNKKLSSNYILEFENILIQQTTSQGAFSNLKAGDIEKKELKQLVSRIKNEQNWVLNETSRFTYPDIFNPEFVSDVISLNFDTLAEQLAMIKNKVPNEAIFRNESSFHTLTPSGKISESFIAVNTSFREVKDANEKGIRFWYPHGSVHKPQHIVLGVSKYATLISKTQEIRANYKAREVEKLKNEPIDFDSIDLTWFSQIINQPVLILGASMSEMEWAMWTAFVHRKRNYAKPEMKQYETPVFIMVDKNQKLPSPQNEWFTPLFEDMDFNQQWKKLEQILNAK